MEDKIYKIRKGFKYSDLGKYGFYKTEPKNVNPWFQCPINTNWNTGLGIWHESIDVNKETNEATVECDYDQWSDLLRNRFNELVDSNIILVE